MTVNVPPTIHATAAGSGGQSGRTVTFSVTMDASSTTPLHYQWYFNSSILANATNTVLTLTGATTSQAGNYYVVVTKRGGQCDQFQRGVDSECACAAGDRAAAGRRDDQCGRKRDVQCDYERQQHTAAKLSMVFQLRRPAHRDQCDVDPDGSDDGPGGQLFGEGGECGGERDQF